MDKLPIIWVVEDDESIQRVMMDSLKIHGYQPVVFGTAEKAHAALRTQALPSLIILDMLLPGMSGVDLVRILKQDKAWEKIPIVVVSVLNSTDELASGLEGKTAFWMNKPFEPGNLIQTIQTILGSMGREEKAN